MTFMAFVSMLIPASGFVRTFPSPSIADMFTVSLTILTELKVGFFLNWSVLVLAISAFLAWKYLSSRWVSPCIDSRLEYL